jgi:hypothetical protein
MSCKICEHEIVFDTEHYETAHWVHAHIVDAALCTGHRDGSDCTAIGRGLDTAEVRAGKLAGDE